SSCEASREHAAIRNTRNNRGATRVLCAIVTFQHLDVEEDLAVTFVDQTESQQIIEAACRFRRGRHAISTSMARHRAIGAHVVAGADQWRDLWRSGREHPQPSANAFRGRFAALRSRNLNESANCLLDNGTQMYFKVAASFAIAFKPMMLSGDSISFVKNSSRRRWATASDRPANWAYALGAAGSEYIHSRVSRQPCTNRERTSLRVCSVSASASIPRAVFSRFVGMSLALATTRIWSCSMASIPKGGAAQPTSISPDMT